MQYIFTLIVALFTSVQVLTYVGLFSNTDGTLLSASPRIFTIAQGGTGTSTAPGTNYVLIGDGTGAYIVDDIANYLTAAGGSGLWTYSAGTDVLQPIIASTSNTAIVTFSSLQSTSTTATSTISGPLAVNGLLDVTYAGTSTFSNGIDLDAGCFAVNGTCVSGGGGGTVTSVAQTVPTGFTITGSPITTSGTLAIGFDTGYSLPLTASTTEGSTAYAWGDHSLVGYLLSSAYYSTTTHANISSLPALSITESQISDLGAYITGVVWGDITGTLSNQSDLQTALNAKISVGTTSVDSITTLSNLSVTESQISDLAHYTSSDFNTDFTTKLAANNSWSGLNTFSATTTFNAPIVFDTGTVATSTIRSEFGNIEFGSSTKETFNIDFRTTDEIVFNSYTGADTWTFSGITLAPSAIANDTITPNSILSTGQTDEYCLTYEATGTTWEWQTCGSGGGATALNELNDVTLTSTTTGDMLYNNSSGQWVNLGIGTANQVLTVSGGIPSWQDAAAASGGAWSTTTDANPEPGELVLYTSDDVYIGGSGSTSAEFNFDVESSTFSISSTTVATGSILVDSGILEVGSSTLETILFDFRTANQWIVDTLTGVTDLVLTGIDLTIGGGDLTIGTTAVLTGGDTTSLDNIDAINDTTETTIETALDTLGGLTSVTIGGDTITEFAGTGLTVTGNALTADLGTDIQESELLINAPVDDYLLVASSTASGGWEWVATSTARLGLTGGGGGSGTVTSVDASVPTGWTISGNPITTSGTLAFAYDTGYEAVKTASTTNWNSFYDTPSTRITNGTHLTWAGNTLNVDDSLSSYTDDLTHYTNADVSTYITTGTGLTEVGGLIDWDTGYEALLTASSTNWNSFYDSPSTRISAGTGLSWSTNTLNAEVQSSDLANYLSLANWYATTTDGLAQGTSNLYNQTHTGEVTGSTALTITDDTVDEANLKVHNAPTDLYLLVASSTANGGIEWMATSSPLLNFSVSAAGGSSAWSTTTDANTEPGELVLYTGDDVYIGGSASTTAEFNFDVESGSFAISSTTVVATGSLMVDSGLFEIGSSTVETVVFDFRTATQWIVKSLTTVVDFVVQGMDIVIDSTAQIIANVGGTDRIVAEAERTLFSVTVASTSPEFLSSDTLPIARNVLKAREITQFVCWVDGGTSKVLNVTDGTNDTETITCGTSITKDTDVATNDTFSADELWYLEFGATTGAVDNVTIEVLGYVNE